MKSFMQQEIEAQPDLILSKSAYWHKKAKSFHSLIHDKKNIVLIGRGTSGNACIFASYLFGLTTGRHPIDFRPWLATQDIPYSDWSDSLVLAYSQSGESTDIIEAVSWLKKRGATIISITNSQSLNPSIAKSSDHLFFLEVEEEKAIPATKTYMAQLMVTAALSGIDIVDSAKTISKAMKIYLESDFSKKLSEKINSRKLVTWLGRGLIQAAAMDSALKLQETVGIPSFGWSSAEYLHGPIASVKKDDLIIFFEHSKELQHNNDENTGKILKILDSRAVEHVIIDSDNDLLIPEENWQKTVFYSFVGQYAALNVALLRGLNPDKPMDLKKVTLT